MLVLARGSQEVQNSVRSKQLISTVDRLLVVHTEDGPRRLTPQNFVLPLGDDLERFLLRVVLCMFAHDSGVAEPRDIFLDFIGTRAGEDGSDELAEPMFLNLSSVASSPFRPLRIEGSTGPSRAAGALALPMPHISCWTLDMNHVRQFKWLRSGYRDCGSQTSWVSAPPGLPRADLPLDVPSTETASLWKTRTSMIRRVISPARLMGHG